MKKDLKEVIILTANYYGKQLNPMVLEMYVEDLEAFDEVAVISAYRSYRKDPKNKFFPLPAQIIEIMSPQASDEAQAIESVNRIILAITKFGYPNPDEAKEFIGDMGWLVVRDYGGWESLCQNMGVEYSEQTFRAQARDSIKSKINLSKAGMLGTPLALPTSEKESLNAPTDIQKLIGSTMKEFPK